MNIRCQTYFELLESSRETVQTTINRRLIEVTEYPYLPSALRGNFIQVLFDHLIVSNQWSSAYLSILLSSSVISCSIPFAAFMITSSQFVWMFLWINLKTALLLLLLTKTSSETLAKLLRMTRSYSTSTNSWALAFPKSYMVPLSISHPTHITQATNIRLKTRSPLVLGLGGSVGLSVLF